MAIVHAGMMSGDMQREQGRRDWETEAQQRYELEQLAEADRDQRVDVSLCWLCPVLLRGYYFLFCSASPSNSLCEDFVLSWGQRRSYLPPPC